MKDSIKEIIHELVSMGKRPDQMEERTSNIEGRNIEIMQREEERHEH